MEQAEKVAQAPPPSSSGTTLGTVALGLGIAAWALMLLQFMVPGIGCIFGSITPVLAIAAIIVGVIAMGGAGRSNGIIGMALGITYLVITIIIAIVAMLFAVGILCLYLGFFGLIFGGTACCSSTSNLVLSLTLLALFGAVKLARRK